MNRVLICVLIAVLALTTLGADTQGRRFERLGHRIMCTCGCNQILLECNHVGCPVSDGMRNELTASINRNQEDRQVMDQFIAKYGFIVIAAPMGTGFDRVAWIMPYLMFVLGIVLAVYLIRVWRGRLTVAPAAPVAPEVMDALRARARKETEVDL